MASERQQVSDRVRLPSELLSCVCDHLSSSKQYGTLAKFAASSRELYAVAAPALYRTVCVDDLQFVCLLSGLDFGSFADVTLAYDGPGDGTSHNRKVELLKGVKHLVLEGLIVDRDRGNTPDPYLERIAENDEGDDDAPNELVTGVKLGRAWLKRNETIEARVAKVMPEEDPHDPVIQTKYADASVTDEAWTTGGKQWYPDADRDNLTPEQRASLVWLQNKLDKTREERRLRGCLFPSLATIQITADAFFSIAPWKYLEWRLRVDDKVPLLQLLNSTDPQHVCVIYPRRNAFSLMTSMTGLDDVDEDKGTFVFTEWIDQFASPGTRFKSVCLHGFDAWPAPYNSDCIAPVTMATSAERVCLWRDDEEMSAGEEVDYWFRASKSLRGYEDEDDEDEEDSNSDDEDEEDSNSDDEDEEDSNSDDDEHNPDPENGLINPAPVVLADFAKGRSKDEARDMWATLLAQSKKVDALGDNVSVLLGPEDAQPCPVCGAQPSSWTK